MDLIAIGRISRPIGIRGRMKILPLTDDIPRFKRLKSVWVGNDPVSADERIIRNAETNKRQVVIDIVGIETQQEANGFRNKYLFIPKDQIIKLQDGRYFIDDILGCEIVTEEKVNIGIVTDLLSLPANDIWVVKNENKEILIPAVKAIVKKIDVKAKRITIHALEGLLE